MIPGGRFFPIILATGLCLGSSTILPGGDAPGAVADLPGPSPGLRSEHHRRLLRRGLDHLVRWQRPDGGFGYGATGPGFAEPTAAALMALAGVPGREDAASRAAAFLGTLRRDEGFAPCAADDEPGWVTAPVLLALARTRPATDPMVTGPRDWLLERDRAFSEPGVEAPGWPWTPGTAPWVEPTAMAVWALAACGQSRHPRVQEGIAMLLKNANRGGGFSLYAYRPYRHHSALVMLALSAAGQAGRVELDATRRFLDGPGLADPARLGRAYGLLAAVRERLASRESILDQLVAESENERPDETGPLETALIVVALRELGPDT